MTPAAHTPREGIGVLLQDPDLIPPVLPVEVKLQAVPHAGVSWESEEGERALLCCPQKYHVVYLGLVYCLADWQSDPVNYGIIPVHSAAVCPHGCEFLGLEPE